MPQKADTRQVAKIRGASKKIQKIDFFLEFLHSFLSSPLHAAIFGIRAVCEGPSPGLRLSISLDIEKIVT